ncbi:MAG: cytochrome c oxidase subunit 3 [Halieaceae bacterium]|jgi:cytochrome c oxidase subunit 3
MATESTSEHELYYVPEKSSLAIWATIGLVLSILGAARLLNEKTFGDGMTSFSTYLLLGGLIVFIATLYRWFSTAIKENRAGMNSAQLKHSYALGMQWFIFSEVMFFFAFFGALFYVRMLAGPWLAGGGEGGAMNTILWDGFEFSWPMVTTPQEAVGGAAAQLIANNGSFVSPHEFVDPWHLPLYNTLLLLSSSVTVHFAHVALKANERKKFNWFLGVSLLLGMAFVALQIEEYREAYMELGLTLNSGIYGSTFFMLTGFHGFHVCMGAFMLGIQWLRSVRGGHFTADDHFGFEASSWYWHFVDVVWVGLFLFVYIL